MLKLQPEFQSEQTLAAMCVFEVEEGIRQNIPQTLTPNGLFEGTDAYKNAPHLTCILECIHVHTNVKKM